MSSNERQTTSVRIGYLLLKQALLKQECQYLLAAIQFFTRIPLPVAAAHDRDSLNQALKYFPLIGWLVGGVCALTFHLAVGLWPASVAIVVSVAVGILLTGALHEDGFADSCDGFGGGWDKPKVLAIMKDPRIGSYAAIGLILILLLKVVALIELAAQSNELVMIALLFAHSTSRLLVLPLPWWLDYARDSTDSKSREMVTARFTTGMLAYSSLFVLLPLLFYQVLILFYAAAIAGLAVFAMGLYFKHRIGGYTGDCLGATQQIAEIILYLSILGLWSSL
jgi:adenosylcobinamide-GDP ribazoletransferase